MPFNVHIEIEKWPLAVPFHITGHTFTALEVVVLTLRDGDFVGRAEAAGVYYFGETAANVAAQIETVRSRIEAGAGRRELISLLPEGGARNAVDCALWDIEAKQERRPVWRLAGTREPKPLLTTYTLGADQPAKMALSAGALTQAKALKLKLTGDDSDAARVKAVRAARSDVWLGVDANQGFTLESLRRLMPVLLDANVQLIEQPLRRGSEGELDGFESPIPLAADESAQGLADLVRLVGRFHVVNIKLDKCGGLTAALAMAERARQLGLKVMVGNMIGTSLAMAPAFVLGQLCDLVDLDGPTFLTADRSQRVQYADGAIWCPPGVWGDPSP